MRSINSALFLLLFLIFSVVNAAPASAQKQRATNLGDCTGQSPMCADVFRSGLGTTGEGILSLEKGVEIKNTRKSNTGDANLLFGATSQCKTVNSFGNGSICQYQPDNPKCDGSNCATDGNATQCLSDRDLGAIDAYTDKKGIGKPWTLVVGEIKTVSKPNEINALYLNTGSTMIIDQEKCKLEHPSACSDDFKIYLNVLHLHTGANLIIKGKVKLYIKYFGFGTWNTAWNSKIIVPKGSSLEIRANDWARFSSEAGNFFSSVIVDGKLKVYALGKDKGSLDLNFEKKDAKALFFKKTKGQEQTYLTTCADENTTKQRCTYIENNTSVKCELGADLSELMEKDWCSKTPKKSKDGTVYEVDCNRTKAASLMRSAKYENGKLTHTDGGFKDFLDKNECYLTEDNITACKKESPFSWTLSQAQCHFDENASVKCSPDATNYSYCYVTAERQNGDIRFEPGLRVFVNPTTKASAQFFAKGDIIAGERWNANTAGSYGAVQLNWSYVKNLDDYIKCRINKNDSQECKLSYRNHNDAGGLGMYASGQIRIHDGSKVQGLLYSSSSENEKAPGKDAPKRYYGTPYCSHDQQKACIAAFLKEPDGEGPTKQKQCAERVSKCYKDCTKCITAKEEACKKKCGDNLFNNIGCENGCQARYKPEFQQECSKEWGTASCASTCRAKEGIQPWWFSDKYSCWLHKVQPELKNLCIQGIGYPGLGKALDHKFVPKRSKSCQVKLLCNDDAKGDKGACKDNPYARDLSKDKNYGIYLGAGTTLKGAAVSKYVVAEQGSKVDYDGVGVKRSRADALCKGNTPPEMRKTNFNVIGRLTNGEKIGNVDGWDFDGDKPIKYFVLDKPATENGENYGKYFTIDNDGNLKFKQDLPENLVGKTLTFKAKIVSGELVESNDGKDGEYSGGDNIQTITVTACGEVGLINIFNVNMSKEVSQLEHSGTPNSKKITTNAMATRIAGKEFELKVATACKFASDKTLSFDLGLYENGAEVAKYGNVVLSMPENYLKDLKITVAKAHKSLTLKATNLKFGDDKQSKTYTSDTFSVRPEYFVIPDSKTQSSVAPAPRKMKNASANPPVLRDVLVAAQEYKVKVKSPVDGFTGAVELNASGEHGKNEYLDATKPGHVVLITDENGKNSKKVPGVVLKGTQPQDLNLSYKGVGNVDLVLFDERWTSVDRPKNALNPSEPDKSKWECKETQGENDCSKFNARCSCDTVGVWQVSFVPERYETRLEY
ncbi:MAG: hypothetical protein ACTTIC_08525, partial [Helicobacteraceae bacterium]